MQDVITYIIVFGLLIVFASLFLYRKDKKRILPLSQQQYPGFELTLSVGKEKNKIIFILFNTNNSKIQITSKNVFIEFIDKDRKRETNAFDKIIERKSKTVSKFNGVVFSYSDLKNSLEKIPFPFVSFRFIFVDDKGHKFKTHELAINSRWDLYKPDSGKYN